MVKKYKKMPDGMIKDIETNTFFSEGNNNIASKQYEKWKADGNTPSPAQTATEKTKEKNTNILNIQFEIVECVLRKNCAKDEGFTDVETNFDNRITALREKLADLV